MTINIDTRLEHGMIHEYIFEMLAELAELANRIHDDDLSEKLTALAHEKREQHPQ